MTDLTWLFRRLRAMSIPEVAWRVSQKSIQLLETRSFKAQKVTVTSRVFNSKFQNLKLDGSRMGLNLENLEYTLENKLSLLGGFDYDKYKKKWNAGYQTPNDWPMVFSYELEYKQRDDIGDARTNWELNRHFQFALLSKNYRASKDIQYLTELIDLFEDWNSKNPFLWGIAWTSVMEVAVRCSNWCYTYCFLEGMPNTDELLQELRIGILNMTEYISKHYSRYSSANNHLIVEAFAIGQAGILFNYRPWIDFSLRIITREFSLQNYTDGVNKELSLHYQGFYMEAVGLLIRLFIKNKIQVPKIWEEWLEKMSQYLCDCIGTYGEVIEFGDNDEGKLLDLVGKEFDYYQYVLQLMSCLLNIRYTNCIGNSENIGWLFTKADIIAAKNKKQCRASDRVCYKEGGNTILRLADQKVLIGIDHGALGFGSIAAHGHADALSFQMYVKGIPVFVDPGTYIYHCDIESRNKFRKTINHNTICVSGMNQSEMLGAFLWGKKANTNLLDCNFNSYPYVVAAETKWGSFSVKREFEIADTSLKITDYSTNADTIVNFNIGPELQIQEKKNGYFITGNDISLYISFKGARKISIVDSYYSFKYGIKRKLRALRVSLAADKLVTSITIGDIEQ